MLTHWLIRTLHPAPFPLLPTAGSGTARPDGAGSAVSILRWQQALRAAGLEKLGNSAGSLTFLAPSDLAFDTLLTERATSWPALLAEPASLRTLLMGHVLTQRHTAARMPAGWLPSVGGDVIGVEATPTGPRLRDGTAQLARLLATDIPAGRAGGALLHVIDRVLQAPRLSLREQLARQPEFSEFTGALERSGLAALLSGDGPMTVLAPHNDGFRRLGARCSSEAMLRRVLSHHLIPGRWRSHELPWGGALRTAEGSPLACSALGLLGSDGPGGTGQPLLEGSDLHARNGVLHRLAAPLMPL